MNLEDEISKSGVTIVKYHAEWCGPCKMMNPVINRVKAVNPELTVVSVDIDKEPEITKANGIASVPTLAFYKDGEFVKSEGFMSEGALNSTIQEL